MVAYSVCESNIREASIHRSVSLPRAAPAAGTPSPSSTATNHHTTLNTAYSLCRRLHEDDAALRRLVIDVFDTAHERLRHRQRQLLRILDAAAAQRINSLWDRCVADADRQSLSEGLPTVDINVDWDCVRQCVENFCSVQISGLSESASPASSLPAVMEDYGAEDHLVMHKPLPVDPSHVRVTVPPCLPEMNGDDQSSDSFEVVASTPPSIASTDATSFDVSCDLNVQSVSGVLPRHPLHDVPSAWLLTSSKPSEMSVSADSALSRDFDDMKLSTEHTTQSRGIRTADRMKWLLNSTHSTNQLSFSTQATPSASSDQSASDVFAPFYDQAASLQWSVNE